LCREKYFEGNAPRSGGMARAEGRRIKAPFGGSSINCRLSISDARNLTPCAKIEESGIARSL